MYTLSYGFKCCTNHTRNSYSFHAFEKSYTTLREYIICNVNVDTFNSILAKVENIEYSSYYSFYNRASQRNQYLITVLKHLASDNMIIVCSHAKGNGIALLDLTD